MKHMYSYILKYIHLDISYFSSRLKYVFVQFSPTIAQLFDDFRFKMTQIQ